jgi:hypothetical protein
MLADEILRLELKRRVADAEPLPEHVLRLLEADLPVGRVAACGVEPDMGAERGHAGGDSPDVEVGNLLDVLDAFERLPYLP